MAATTTTTTPPPPLVALETLDVLQFCIGARAQSLLCTMQDALLLRPYDAFGRLECSEERLIIVFPKTFGSDRRKPVAPAFQDFCEEVYWPVVNALLFGVGDVWTSIIRPHLTSFKLNFLRISEDEFYYNQPIYHFHLDHKIGKLEPKDENQIRTMRLIFSTCPGALEEEEAAPAPAAAATTPNASVDAIIDAADASIDVAAAAATAAAAASRSPWDSTVYLKWQPPSGFHGQNAFHEYMTRRFPEVGLSKGRERPLYAVADDELYRAKPGEICIHRSHPGVPIHAETNPCPEGRCLYVLDWADLRNLTHKPNGKVDKVLPSTRMPTSAILSQMRVLADEDGDGEGGGGMSSDEVEKRSSTSLDDVVGETFGERLAAVDATATALLDDADRLWPEGGEGRAALRRVLEHVRRLRGREQ